MKLRSLLRKKLMKYWGVNFLDTRTLYNKTMTSCKVLALIALNLAMQNLVFADQPDDLDFDGVPDTRDQCLNTPPIRKRKATSKYAALFTKDELSSERVSVPVDATGCALDGDKDGVPDHLDYCPDNTPQEISKGVSKNGCSRHSDADGTPDYRDRCPDTRKGIPTDRFGCPKQASTTNKVER
jgi:OOP family OmpA-OmpF porin